MPVVHARPESGHFLVEVEGIARKYWDLPSKSDTEGIRRLRDEATAFGEKHGARPPQIRAIHKALTEAGYYLLGPQKERAKRQVRAEDLDL